MPLGSEKLSWIQQRMKRIIERIWTKKYIHYPCIYPKQTEYNLLKCTNLSEFWIDSCYTSFNRVYSLVHRWEKIQCSKNKFGLVLQDVSIPLALTDPGHCHHGWAALNKSSKKGQEGEIGIRNQHYKKTEPLLWVFLSKLIYLFCVRFKRFFWIVP